MRFFETLPEYDPAMYIHKKMKTTKENSLETLQDVLPILEAQEDYSNDALYEKLAQYVAEKGVKTGFVMWPIRTALSGKQMTPAGELRRSWKCWGRKSHWHGSERELSCCPDRKLQIGI